MPIPLPRKSSPKKAEPVEPIKLVKVNVTDLDVLLSHGGRESIRLNEDRGDMVSEEPDDTWGTRITVRSGQVEARFNPALVQGLIYFTHTISVPEEQYVPPEAR